LGKPDEKNTRSTSSPFSHQAQMKQFPLELLCNHKKIFTQYYSYSAHMKCKVLFYILNPLRYLPEDHLRHRKAMILTRWYPLLTLEPLLFHL